MPRFENLKSRLEAFDWRGWLAVAWVLWFGFAYGKMVIEQRGAKFKDAVNSVRQIATGAQTLAVPESMTR